MFHTFTDYLEFHRVRLRVLAEVSIAIILREIFISLYSLGIKTIDEQHKMLILSFVNIENAIHSKLAWSDIHYSILELKELASIHFTVEEALMELFGYPESTAHKKIHENFFHRLEDILTLSIRKSVDKEMLTLLEEWLIKHILGTDKDYAKFILASASVVRSESE